MPDIMLCRVELLDEAIITVDLNKKAFGHHLLEHVLQHVNVREKEYFGLQFENDKGYKEWLEPLKPIKKQLRDAPHSFQFLVKFYAPHPQQLQDEVTRYLFCLQLRKDLLNGLLPCSVDTAALLASLAVQSEYGEFDAREHDEATYLHSFSMLHNEPPEFITQVAALHKTHGKLLPAEADYRFIEECNKLNLCGIHFYPVVDQHGSTVRLGVSHTGVAVYDGELPHLICTANFPWSEISEIFFNRKKLSVLLRPVHSRHPSASEAVTFRLERESACKIIWKACVEHHTFFRRSRLELMPKDSVFSRSMSHRFSGRTQQQVIEAAYNSDGSRKPDVQFVRTSSLTREHFRVMSPHYSCGSLQNLPRSKMTAFRERRRTPSDSRPNGSASASTGPLSPRSDGSERGSLHATLL